MYDSIVFIACLAVGISITHKVIPSLIVALVVAAMYSHHLHSPQPANYEAMRSGSGGSKRSGRKKSNGRRTMKKFLKNREFKKDTYNFDPQQSLKETYKSLTKYDSEGLNKDTKDLIKTQQQLMGTLKDMGPVLEQGKSIISAFDSFFKDGGSKKQDLAYMSKRLGLANLPTPDSLPMDGSMIPGKSRNKKPKK